MLFSKIYLTILNQSFLWGLVLLLLGCASLVIRSGFFTLFLDGFVQLREFFFRKPKALKGDLYKPQDPEFEKKIEMYIQRATSLLLATGSALLLFSIVLTIFYYLFS